MRRKILYSILNEWRDDDMDDSPIDLDDDMDIEHGSSDMDNEPNLDDDDFALSTTNKKLEKYDIKDFMTSIKKMFTFVHMDLKKLSYYDKSFSRNIELHTYSYDKYVIKNFINEFNKNIHDYVIGNCACLGIDDITLSAIECLDSANDFPLFGIIVSYTDKKETLYKISIYLNTIKKEVFNLRIKLYDDGYNSDDVISFSRELHDYTPLNLWNYIEKLKNRYLSDLNVYIFAVNGSSDDINELHRIFLRTYQAI